MSRPQEGSFAEECERAVVPPDGFSKALRNGNLEQVRRFLQINSSLVNTKVLDYGVKEGSENCGREFTPLMHAIREHHGSGRNILELVEMVRVLLDYKPDINAQNNEGWTALHYAVLFDFVQVVELLLQYHAKVNVRDIYGSTPFLLSAGNAEIARLLMVHGANVNRTNHKGYPDWLLAIDHCNVTTFKLLLTEHYVGVLDLSAKWGEDGWSAVHRAAAYGTLETLEYLLDHAAGVDVNARTTHGKTPLHYAVLGHYPEPPRVQLLLRRGANVNAADHDGDTAFALVCRKALDSDDTTQVAELLIDHGADIHRWGDGKEPLLDAVSQEYINLSLVELILKQEEMDLNAKASDHGSANTLAFKIIYMLADHVRIDDTRHRQIFMWLIEYGADVKAQHQPSGWTLLHFAAVANYNGDKLEAGVRLLLQQGSHINAVDQEGWTPLLYACRCGHWNIARMLVAHGADVNIAAGGSEATPLSLACAKNEEPMVQLLLGAGAQVDYRLNDGVTALLKCVQIGLVKCAILLLERGADIHAGNNRTGNTPFFRACQRGKLNMIYCLIRLSPHDRRLGLPFSEVLS